jgi:Zn-dependent protease
MQGRRFTPKELTKKAVLLEMFNIDWKELVYTLPVILFSLTTHEFFHAFTAYKFGDNTPLEQGRVTLNPLPHIDWFGLILMIVAHFGWAKPVLIDPRNFRKPKQDEIWVSLAGPIANLVLAVVFGLVYKIIHAVGPEVLFQNDAVGLLERFFAYGIWINLALAVFNLLPVPPLDGSHLLMILIPDRYYEFKRKLLQFGTIALIVVLVADSQFNTNLLPLFPVTNYLFKGLTQFLRI